MGTPTGYWDLGGTGGQIALDIPGPASAAYSDIWVQVTYDLGITDVPVVTLPGAQFISAQTVLVEPDGMDSWMLDQSLWRIQPSLGSTQVMISSGSWGLVVDQVVVDTMTTPEPASLAMLGLAGCVLLRRNRRA